MAVIRLGKIGEVAERAAHWLDVEVDARTDLSPDTTVSIGHVMVLVEVRERAGDAALPEGRLTRAWIASYCDDSRHWIQRAILKEASEVLEGESFTGDVDA